MKREVHDRTMAFRYALMLETGPRGRRSQLRTHLTCEACGGHHAVEGGSALGPNGVPAPACRACGHAMSRAEVS